MPLSGGGAKIRSGKKKRKPKSDVRKLNQYIVPKCVHKHLKILSLKEFKIPLVLEWVLKAVCICICFSKSAKNVFYNDKGFTHNT